MDIDKVSDGDALHGLPSLNLRQFEWPSLLIYAFSNDAGANLDPLALGSISDSVSHVVVRTASCYDMRQRFPAHRTVPRYPYLLSP